MKKAHFSRRVRELQAQDIKPLQWSDVLTVNGGSFTAEEEAALNLYFGSFAELPHDAEGRPVCFGCGKRFIDGMMGAFLGGLLDDTTSWEWSLTHGECHCRECGWPARAYHYDIGKVGDKTLIQRLNATLAVHPALLVIQPQPSTLGVPGGGDDQP